LPTCKYREGVFADADQISGYAAEKIKI